MACEKHPFKGKASAERVRKNMKSNAYDTAGLHVYWCRECGAYHIGHAWQNRRVRV